MTKMRIQFKGRLIDTSLIQNPRLARVFRERVYDGERFLFSYGDHSEHTEKYSDAQVPGAYGDYGGSCHTEEYRRYRDWSDHTEHTESR